MTFVDRSSVGLVQKTTFVGRFGDGLVKVDISSIQISRAEKGEQPTVNAIGGNPNTPDTRGEPYFRDFRRFPIVAEGSPPDSLSFKPGIENFLETYGDTLVRGLVDFEKTPPESQTFRENLPTLRSIFSEATSGGSR